MFGKGKKGDQQPAPAATTPVMTKVDAPATGTVSLKKGQSISLKKGENPIVASNGWKAKGKDYDLKALVRYRDGRLIYVGAANSDESLRTPEGAVSHSGDARSPGELEKITIAWHPDIASVALSSYSALENGAGSFRKYGVFVNIENNGQTVGIDAADANADSNSYTCCFGEVIFEEGGHFTVINHEMYSRGGSENRIGYQGDRVMMDIGPRGQNK